MKDPLFGNKVAAAVLVTLLIAVGLPIVFNTLGKVFSHHGGHHELDEANPFGLAYIPAEIKFDASEDAGADVPLDLGTLLAAASAERGQRAAGACAACHTFEKGGSTGIGPNLWGVVGRDIGSVSGFGYSAALAALEGTWTYDRLDPYLANSQTYVPGTQMVQVIRKAEKRADILAYLASLSDAPVPFPAPAPVAAAEPAADAAIAEGTDPAAADITDAAPEAADAAADPAADAAAALDAAIDTVVEPVAEPVATGE